MRRPLVRRCCSKFQMLWRPGEGNDITDIGHPRDGHQEALEPEAETGVRYGTESSNVEIPPVVLSIHTRFLHPPFEPLEAFFALTATDEFSHSRDQQIHGSHGSVVIVYPHIKGFDFLGV